MCMFNAPQINEGLVAVTCTGSRPSAAGFDSPWVHHKESAMHKVLIIRTRKASTSYGDRAAEIRTAARYRVEVDGATVATIECETDGGYMSPRIWALREVNSRKVWYRKTLKDAKAAAHKNYGQEN